jgi:hypothetical protein
VRINVSAANSSTCLRLLLTTRDCAGGVSASGVGSSALIVHNRIPGGSPPDRHHPNKIVNI